MCIGNAVGCADVARVLFWK